MINLDMLSIEDLRRMYDNDYTCIPVALYAISRIAYLHNRHDADYEVMFREACDRLYFRLPTELRWLHEVHGK